MSQRKRKCCYTFTNRGDNSSSNNDCGCQNSNTEGRKNSNTCPWPGDGGNICFQPDVMFLCAQLVDSCRSCNKTCTTLIDGVGGNFPIGDQPNGGGGGNPIGDGGGNPIGDQPNGGGGGGDQPPNGGQLNGSGDPPQYKTNPDPNCSLDYIKFSLNDPPVTPAFGQGIPSAQEEINTITKLSQAHKLVKNQGIRGITVWSTDDKYYKDANSWDCKETKDPCKTPPKEMLNWIFPSYGAARYGGLAMRGLDKVYDQVKPFKDENNPTVQEIEEWNRIVILHFRRLMGITTPLENDRCFYLKTQWANERHYSTIWDALYPGTCQGSTDLHCGFTFEPDCKDQTKYIVNGGTCCPKSGSKIEGISGAALEIPWALKIVKVIGGYLNQDGYYSHTIPYLTCKKVGQSWHIRDPNPEGGWVEHRAQWSDCDTPTCDFMK